MRADWKTRILRLKHRTTQADNKELVALVYEAAGECTPEVAKTLMQTFTGEEDYEVQESVASVLASASPEIYHAALLEELPRLLDEAPQWAEDLVGHEVEFRPLLLASAAKKMNEIIKASLVQLLTTSSFTQFYPNAEQVVRELVEE